jgi:hypothetical protein
MLQASYAGQKETRQTLQVWRANALSGGTRSYPDLLIGG